MHYALLTGDPDDPDEIFDYTDDDLDSPVVKLLERHGLSIPPRP
jgi:hypothetical protein